MMRLTFIAFVTLAVAGLEAASAMRVHVARATPTVACRRVSTASAMMAAPARWPEIIRGYVAAKFATVDADNSGEVDRSELAEMYRMLMPDATDAERTSALDDFFKEFDADKSGDIDQEEFLVAVMSNKLLNSNMRLKEQVYEDVLKTFDASGKKLISDSAFDALEAQLDWEGSNLPQQLGKLAKAFAG